MSTLGANALTGDRPILLDIGSVVVSDTPRLGGADAAHIRVLAEIEGTALPPITVHATTMRVIDGVHRLRAAELRGDDQISALLYHGSEANAFVLAVEANVTHGLPLSLSEREAAATRIIRSYPSWSDRAIAALAGLSTKKVAAIRGQLVAELPEPDRRVGLDGRARPVDFAEGRQRAVAAIRADPDASVRQIARVAGISRGTARDVLERLRKGADPIPTRARDTAPNTVPDPVPIAVGRSPGADRLRERIQRLKSDPSLRYNEEGRRLLRWLDSRVPEPEDWRALADAVPSHCADLIAEISLSCAGAWHDFARELKRRAD